MISKRKPYEMYTKEFKLDAIRLMEDSGCPPAKEDMSELAILKQENLRLKE